MPPHSSATAHPPGRTRTVRHKRPEHDLAGSTGRPAPPADAYIFNFERYSIRRGRFSH